MTHDTTPTSASADTVAALAAELKLPEGVELTERGLAGLDPAKHSADALLALTQRIAAALDRREKESFILRWAIGSLINASERRHGDVYTHALQATGLKYSTLADYAYVERQIPPEARQPSLPWTIHRECASLPTVDDRKHWLGRIATLVDNGVEIHSRDVTEAIQDAKYIRAGLDPQIERLRDALFKTLDKMTDKLDPRQRLDLWRSLLTRAAERDKMTLAELLREIEPTLAVGDAAPPHVVPVYQNGREVTGLVM